MPIAQSRQEVDLSGAWEFCIDPDDVGLARNWQVAGPFDRRITVPGAWNAQGVSCDNAQLLRECEERNLQGVVPELRGPGNESSRMYHPFPGPAWYRRKLSVPEHWAGEQIWLVFEGVHRYAEVWVNGVHLGGHLSYLTGFRFNVTQLLKPGTEATVVVRVDARRNREIDPLTGGVDTYDFVYVAWGGLHKPVRLEATAANWIQEVFVIPRLEDESVTVQVELGGERASLLELRARVLGPDGQEAASGVVSVAAGVKAAELRLFLPQAKRWSPLQPHLYTLQLRLMDGTAQLDLDQRRFGMREFTVAVGGAGRFLLNGQPIFLRGYGDDSIFPNSIAAPSDPEEFRRRLMVAREFGFNYVRHHSWFPPQEYFEVADELGMMVQPEFPFSYSFCMPTSPAAWRLALEQWAAVIREYRNHASLVTWCMGNEHYKSFAQAPEMYRIAKELDPSRPVIDSDGVACTVEVLEKRSTLDFYVCQFNEAGSIGHGDPKYQLPPGLSKPVVAHEMGYFATLPELNQAELFQEGLRPYWLEEVRDQFASRHDLAEYPAWREASYRLQALCVKTNMEAARRSALQGFSHWLFQDYPRVAEGTVDMFFRPKAQSPAAFRAFNAPTVLLLDTPRRSFRGGEEVVLPLLVSRYEHAPTQEAIVRWQLTVGDELLASGNSSGLSINSDGVQPLLSLPIHLPRRARAGQLLLSVALSDGDGSTSNDWNLWLFPEERLAGTPGSVVMDFEPGRSRYPWASVQASGLDPAVQRLLVTSRLDEPGLDYLERGGRVLLLDVETAMPAAVTQFRGGSWDPRAIRDHMGTIIDRAHPALAGMPNEGWCDLQFYHLITGAKSLLLGELPIRVEPIVRLIDLPQRFAERALLAEVGVGTGKLLLCGFNLPVALSLMDPAGEFLLDVLMRYALNASFRPTAALPVAYLRERIRGALSAAKQEA